MKLAFHLSSVLCCSKKNFLTKLIRRCLYYFTSRNYFYRSPWQPVTSLPLLVSIERRTRRLTGDVMLCCRCRSELCACLCIRRTMAPGISPDSSSFKHDENTSEFELKMATRLSEVCGYKELFFTCSLFFFFFTNKISSENR